MIYVGQSRFNIGGRARRFFSDLVHNKKGLHSDFLYNEINKLINGSIYNFYILVVLTQDKFCKKFERRLIKRLKPKCNIIYNRIISVG